MAQPGTTRTVGLALEGGGYRGMYTAGVLDVWMEHGLTCDLTGSVTTNTKVTAIPSPTAVFKIGRASCRERV